MISAQAGSSRDRSLRRVRRNQSHEPLDSHVSNCYERRKGYEEGRGANLCNPCRNRKLCPLGPRLESLSFPLVNAVKPQRTPLEESNILAARTLKVLEKESATLNGGRGQSHYCFHTGYAEKGLSP